VDFVLNDGFLLSAYFGILAEPRYWGHREFHRHDDRKDQESQSVKSTALKLTRFTQVNLGPAGAESGPNHLF
jgi:hypothetical protein